MAQQDVQFSELKTISHQINIYQVFYGKSFYECYLTAQNLSCEMSRIFPICAF